MEGNQLPKICIAADAQEQFLRFVQEQGFQHFSLVCDENEYRALGRQLEEKLRMQQADVLTILLPPETLPDETHIAQVLLPFDERPRVYLAAGSGTLTDIVRFASHRSGKPFISLPTAASMDGYASQGSSLTLKRFKATIRSRPPLAIFADLRVIAQAPRELTAAGFGDMIGKFSALADWRLSHLLTGEGFDEGIAVRSARARGLCLEHVDALESNWDKATAALMHGLIEEGLCMLEWGNSRPASGAEHMLSHYWEMKLARENRPPVFHGAKVGLASVLVARCYEQLSSLSRQEAGNRLQASHLPNAEEEKRAIRLTFGERADAIIQLQQASLTRAPAQYEALKAKVLSQWDEIQTIAAQVPAPQEILRLLQQTGSTTHPSALGIRPEEVLEALIYAPYIRTYFTVLTLNRMLQLPLPLEVF